MWRVPLILSAALLLAAATGCRSLRPEPVPTPQEKAEQSAFWKPQLLFLAPWPYPKLNVEIDVVEGSAPTAEQLANLERFLLQVCDKPGGIRVAIDDTIPETVARRRSSHSLALEFYDGPPDAFTATIYILYYDSRVTTDKVIDPYFTALPFPGAIFADRRLKTFASSDLVADATRVLQHELGHALGLTRDTSHSDGVHCTRPNCLMNAKYQVKFDLLKMKHYTKLGDFCPECLANLAWSKTVKPEDNLRFVGPALVRSEKAYQVASLPGLVYVHFPEAGPLTPRVIAQQRSKALAMKTQPTYGITLRLTSGFRTQTSAALSAELAKDPLKVLRELAELVRQQTKEPANETDRATTPK